MRFASVCSGIEAASCAWHPLGWSAAWLSEIEAFPSRLLASRWPDSPNLGDMTKITKEQISDHGPIDLLVGGTPCQSFSVAGLRKGLDDPRGNLALEFLRLADAARPEWLLWENVPGVLSSGGGRDFGTFLGGLVQLGYRFAYRVLDAQFFGVPQRRRRVFVVGHSGDWRRAAAVLFERDCLSWNPPPSRASREDVAGSLTASAGGSDENDGRDGRLLSALRTTHSGPTAADQGHVIAHALRGEGFDASEDGTGRGIPLVASTGETSHCLNAGGMGRQDFETETLVAFAIQERAACENTDAGPGGKGWNEETTFTLEARTTPQGVATFDPRNVTSKANRARVEAGLPAATLHAHGQSIIGRGVRRLTPRECERLQGFPDDYTAIPKASDSARYKALGNSMAVPVMRWIGERIAEVSAIK